MLVEHDLAVEHVIDGGGAHGLEIGAVDPLQLASAGHAPGGERRLAEHFEEGHRIARNSGASLFKAGAGARFFKALDGRVGDPEHGAGAGRASIGFKEAAGWTDDGEREGRAVVAELFETFPEGRVLSVAVARFEIGEAFENADAGIIGRAVIGKAEDAHEGDRRSVKIGQAPFRLRLRLFAFVGFFVFPDHDDAGVGAEYAFRARQTLARFLFFFAIFARRAACAVGYPQGPEKGCDAERCRACDEQDKRLGQGHVHGRHVPPGPNHYAVATF